MGFVAITIDLDQQGDPALKVDQLDKLVTLGNQRGVVAIGNADVTIFERATQAEIEAGGAPLHRHGRASASRFVLSTSCELPPRANPDCVTWMMNAAREYGRYDRILSALNRRRGGARWRWEGRDDHAARVCCSPTRLGSIPRIASDVAPRERVPSALPHSRRGTATRRLSVQSPTL